MPLFNCPEPANANIVTQTVKINDNSVNIRKGNSSSTEILKTVNKGYTMLRIELAEKQNNGNYWDKVVLQDGRVGYVVRYYLEQVQDVKTCDELLITNKNTVLRNGPGLNGTTVVATLVTGQIVNRIEKDKYNLDNAKWDRVVLQDGRQGYIEQTSIDLPKDYKIDKKEVVNDIIRVICNSGLKVRENAGTDKNIVSFADKGIHLLRLESDVSKANGYVWDKVVTSNGIVGYIARGSQNESYIEVVSSLKVQIPEKEPVKPQEQLQEQQGGQTGNENNNQSGDQKPNDVNEEKIVKTKIDNNNFLCIPEVKVEDLAELYKGKTITVKKSDKKTKVTTGPLATGYVITIDKKTYNVVKLGDVNGDGLVKATDYMTIKNYIMNVSKLSDIEKIAADVNKDKSIKATDYMTIKNFIMGVSKIELN